MVIYFLAASVLIEITAAMTPTRDDSISSRSARSVRYERDPSSLFTRIQYRSGQLRVFVSAPYKVYYLIQYLQRQHNRLLFPFLRFFIYCICMY
jgi:hypothetical protein